MTVARVELRVATPPTPTRPVVLTASGEVDATNAADFAASVRSLAGSGQAILDLSELAYLDSAGYAVLDGLIAAGLVRLVLDVHSRVRRAATLLGLPFSESVDAAIKQAGPYPEP